MNQIAFRDTEHHLPNEADPILPLYRAWTEGWAEWSHLTALPGGEDCNSPAIRAVEARRDAALAAMLDLTPTTAAGVAALADVLWSLAGPWQTADDPELAAAIEEPSVKLIRAIWQAGSGRTGLPPSHHLGEQQAA